MRTASNTCTSKRLLGMAALAAADRDDERAATLEGRRHGRSASPLIAPSGSLIYERLEANLTEARTRPGEQEWQSARTRGGSITPAAALSVAFSHLRPSRHPEAGRGCD